MLTALKNNYWTWSSKCEAIASKNYFTNIYGLARSLFALSMAISLLVNSQFELFNQADFIGRQAQDFSNVNFFLLFAYKDLIWAKLIALTILITVISGYFPRFTGLLHWWLAISYYQAISIPEGGDQIAANVTFFLVFITLMDTRLNHWNEPHGVESPYKNFMAYLLFGVIAIQIAVLYLHSAVHKVYNTEEWIDGTAMYYWFNNTVFGLNDTMKVIIQPIIDTPILLFALNWGVIVFELLLFCGILANERTRKNLLICGIVFHLLIAVMLGLYSFFINMSACLILFLAPMDASLDVKFIRSRLVFKGIKLKKHTIPAMYGRLKI